MADVPVRLGGKTQAWVNANQSYVLLERQHLYILDGVNAGRYFIGNGTTPLSGLPLYGGSGSYTFENGLTESGGNVTLGGALTGNTQIDGNFDLELGANTPLNNLNVTTNTAITKTVNDGVNQSQVTQDTTHLNVGAELRLSAKQANRVLFLDSNQDVQGLALSANQSIRRNAGNTAFEAYESGYSPQDFPYINRWFHGLCFGGRSYTQTSPTQIWYSPVLFTKTITLTNLGFIFLNNGPSFRLGVYTSTINSYPGDLLYDSGNIVSTGNAFYDHTMTSPLTLTAGLYYLSFCNNTNATGGAFKGYCSVVDSTNINIATDRGVVFLGTVGAFGSFPATANAVPLAAAQPGPLIYMKKS